MGIRGQCSSCWLFQWLGLTACTRYAQGQKAQCVTASRFQAGQLCRIPSCRRGMTASNSTGATSHGIKCSIHMFPLVDIDKRNQSPSKTQVVVRNITTWFQGNGGLIQFGWKPRNLAQITCEEPGLGGIIRDPLSFWSLLAD